jgi:hypothetical protein
MLPTFSFGKRRRVVKKSRKAGHRKPPAKLLKLAKKYHVKTTKKVGSKRVYKSVAVLKRQLLKKLRALKKRAMKHSKKHTKKSVRRYRFGEELELDGPGMSFGEKLELDGLGMSFGRYPQFGNVMHKAQQKAKAVAHAVKHGFGKRRRVAKVSKAHAMKAFRAFYKRHCSANRRSRFGSSNPALVNSMGYEFCSDGVGGVLGSNSTGLFPSPCVSASSSGKAPGFGRRRSSSAGKSKLGSRMSSAGKSKLGSRMSSAGKSKLGSRKSSAGKSKLGSRKSSAASLFGKRRRARSPLRY